MADGQQYDFSRIAKPIPPGMNIKASQQPGAFDFSRVATPLTDNPNKEGTYSMATSDGSTIQTPFSKVLSMGRAGYKLDPKDYSRFTQDFHYAHAKDKIAPSGSDSPESVFGGVSGTEKVERKGYGLLRSAVDLLPTAGSIVGGLLTGVPGLATGPGDIAIAAAGAAGGAAIGEAARQGIDDFIWGETMTPGQRAKRIAGEAGMGALSEFGGRIVGKPLLKGAQWFTDTATEAAKAGFRLLPSEARGMAPGFVERYAKASLLSSGRMAAWREAQNRETTAAAEKLADSIIKFKGTNEQVGKMVQKGVESYKTGFRTVQEAAYKQIDQKVAQAGIKPERRGLVDFAKQELAKIEEAKKAGGASVVSPRFEKLLNDIIGNTDPTASYQGMARARSAWLDMARSMIEPLSGPEKGFVQKLGEKADIAMMDAAKKSGVPGLVNEVRAANQLTRATHEKFEEGLIKKVVRTKEPSKITGMLTAPSTSPEGAKTLMELLPANYRPVVQSHILRDAITRATGEGKIAFDERGFAKSILKLGDDKGKVVFGNNWQRIRDVAVMMSHITGESTGRGGAAELANPLLVKQAMQRITELSLHLAGIPVALGTGQIGHFAIGVGVEAGAINTFVSALKHPAAAARVLRGLQILGRGLAYASNAAINVAMGQADREEREKEASQPAAGEESPEEQPSEQPPAEQKPSSLTEMKTESAQRNPTAPPNSPNKQYQHVLQDPDTGHMVGTDDNGNSWYDVQTGQRVD